MGPWRVDPRLNEIALGEQSRHLEPLVMDLLLYLASRPGEVVTKDELTREVWKGRFIGDAALVSAVSALRRAFDDEPREPRVLQTVPKRGYRLIAPVAGGAVSVAVLPLENLSGDPGQEFFADGMTEALISALSRNPRGLRVISRTSSMRYKGSSLSLPEIAKSLGVDMVIEGSVLRQGDLVRMTVQLIEAETDQHLWSEVFDRGLGDVLALQSELAYLVERRIHSELGLQEELEPASASEVDPKSFLEYLRGRFEFYRLTKTLFARALDHFERARELDPSSPYPYLGIYQVWGWRATWGLVPAIEAAGELRDAAAKALEFGEELAEPHANLAKYAYYFERDWPKAERAFERALEIDPNDAYGLWGYALFLCCRGRPSEALSLARRGAVQDPLSSLPDALLGLSLALLGRSEEGLAPLRRACALERLPPPRWALWMVLAGLGRRNAALEQAADYFSSLGRVDTAELLRERGSAEGYAAAMAAAAEGLASQRRIEYVQPTQIARLHLHAGQHQRALEWLQCGYRESDISLAYLGFPEWEPLRSEPSFRDLLKRVGLPVQEKRPAGSPGRP